MAPVVIRYSVYVHLFSIYSKNTRLLYYLYVIRYLLLLFCEFLRMTSRRGKKKSEKRSRPRKKPRPSTRTSFKRSAPPASMRGPPFFEEASPEVLLPLLVLLEGREFIGLELVGRVLLWRYLPL